MLSQHDHLPRDDPTAKILIFIDTNAFLRIKFN